MNPETLAGDWAPRTSQSRGNYLVGAECMGQSGRGGESFIILEAKGVEASVTKPIKCLWSGYIGGGGRTQLTLYLSKEQVYVYSVLCNLCVCVWYKLKAVDMDERMSTTEHMLCLHEHFDLNSSLTQSNSAKQRTSVVLSKSPLLSFSFIIYQKLVKKKINTKYIRTYIYILDCKLK